MAALLIMTLATFYVLCQSRNFGPTVTAPARFEYGDFMTSNNSQYHAIMQQDGNFVIYRGTLADSPSDAKWRTRTNQHSNGPYHLDLQTDNNLVLYDIYQMPLWSSLQRKKYRGTPPARLSLENNGNLVLRDANNKTLWWSDGDLKDKVKVTKPPKKPKKTNGWD